MVGTLPGFRRDHRDPAAAALRWPASLGLRLARAQAARGARRGRCTGAARGPAGTRVPQGAGGAVLRGHVPSVGGRLCVGRQRSCCPRCANALGEWTGGRQCRMLPLRRHGSAGTGSCAARLDRAAEQAAAPPRTTGVPAPIVVPASLGSSCSRTRCTHRGAVMPEAVIVATARRPIGRAARARSTTAAPTTRRSDRPAALDKVPAVDPHEVDDLMVGCGQPAGEAGYNIGRVVACCSGYDVVPGTGQPLLRVVAADHPHGLPRHQGRRGRRVRRAGVETVSRYAQGQGDGCPTPRTLCSPRRGATAKTPTAPRPDDPARGPAARRVHRDGPDRRERRARPTASAARSRTNSASASQNRAERAITSGFFGREIIPGDGGRRHRGQQGRRPAGRRHAREARPLKPVFRPDGTVTAGNCCPLNDGAARGGGDE